MKATRKPVNGTSQLSLGMRWPSSGAAWEWISLLKSRRLRVDEKYSQNNTLVLVSTIVPTFPVSLAPGKGTEAIFELSRLFF